MISWPNEPLPDCRLSTIVFILARMTLKLSIVPWLALTTSVRLGVSSVFNSSPSCNMRPGRDLAVDVDDGIAQHADGGQRGG